MKIFKMICLQLSLNLLLVEDGNEVGGEFFMGLN